MKFVSRVQSGDLNIDIIQPTFSKFELKELTVSPRNFDNIKKRRIPEDSSF